MFLNKALIVGNLTRDPELKALPSGMSVASFSVATNRKYKDRDGKMQESVDFHNVVAFGRTAENISQFLKKGSQILVEGRLQTRSWDKDGVKHYRTEIVADFVQFGARRDKPTDEQQSPSDDVELEYPKEEIDPSDVPF